VPQPSPLSLSFTHYLPCSRMGETALKIAIEYNNADVAAYLRSIGAPCCSGRVESCKADVAVYLRSIGAPE
jgi:hypothetical protein